MNLLIWIRNMAIFLLLVVSLLSVVVVLCLVVCCLFFTTQISNISIKGQDFGESVFEPGTTFVLAHFDGVLGLGYPSLAVGNALPVFDSIMNQNLVEEPIFSFYLKRSVFKMILLKKK